MAGHCHCQAVGIVKSFTFDLVVNEVPLLKPIELDQKSRSKTYDNVASLRFPGWSICHGKSWTCSSLDPIRSDLCSSSRADETPTISHHRNCPTFWHLQRLSWRNESSRQAIIIICKVYGKHFSIAIPIPILLLSAVDCPFPLMDGDR